MAITSVQVSTEIVVSSGTAGNVTLTGVAAGNMLVAYCSVIDDSSAGFTVTDDKGNTWALAVQQPGDVSAVSSEVQYTANVASGNTQVTVTANNTTSFRAVIHEVSGGGAVDVVSKIQEGSNTTSHTCSASASVIDTTEETIVVCVSVVDTTSNATFGTLTEGSGYTRITSSTTQVMWQYQIFATAQANEQGAFTSSSSRKGIGAIAAFKFLAAPPQTYSRSLAESLAMTDTPTRKCTNVRQLSDTMGLHDAQFHKTRYSTFSSERLGMSDSVSAMVRTFLRNLVDNLGVSDPTIDRLATYYRGLTDNMAMVDTPTRTTDYKRQLAENLAMVDAVGGVSALAVKIIQVIELLAMSDLPTRQVEVYRQLAEAIGMADLVARQGLYNRQLSDNLAMVDQATRALDAFIIITDYLGMADLAILASNVVSNIIRSRPFYRPQTLDMADSRVQNVDVAGTLIESVETEPDRIESSDEQVQ